MTLTTNQAFIQSLPISASLLGNQFGLTVKIGGRVPATDGKVIHLGCFDDAKMTREEKMDFLGSFVHECGHLAHSYFPALQEISRSGKDWELLLRLWNVLEDARIEKLNSEQYPGSHILRYYAEKPCMDAIRLHADVLSSFDLFCAYELSRLNAKIGKSYAQPAVEALEPLIRRQLGDALLKQIDDLCDQSIEPVCINDDCPTRYAKNLASEVLRLLNTAGIDLNDSPKNNAPNPSGSSYEADDSAPSDDQTDASDEESSDTDDSSDSQQICMPVSKSEQDMDSEQSKSAGKGSSSSNDDSSENEGSSDEDDSSQESSSESEGSDGDSEIAGSGSSSKDSDSPEKDSSSESGDSSENEDDSDNEDSCDGEGECDGQHSSESDDSSENEDDSEDEDSCGDEGESDKQDSSESDDSSDSSSEKNRGSADSGEGFSPFLKEIEEFQRKLSSDPETEMVNLLKKYQLKEAPEQSQEFSMPVPFKLSPDQKSSHIAKKCEVLRKDSKHLASSISRAFRGILEGRGRDDCWTSDNGANVDASRCYRLSNWDLRVFRKEVEAHKGTISFNILVDRSSSMGGDTMREACAGSIGLFEGVRSLPGVVPTLSFFPAYGGDEPLAMVVDAGKSLVSKAEEIGLHLTSEGGTPALEALLSYEFYFAQEPAERKILFIITDGAVGSYLKDVLLRLRNAGVEVYVIGIQADPSAIKEIFGEKYCATIQRAQEIPAAIKTLSKVIWNA